MLDKLKPLSFLLLIASVATYVLFLWVAKLQNPAQRRMWLQLLQCGPQAYTGLWMTLWCLCVSKHCLDYSNHTLR